jgi:hypothetical protein
MKPPFSRIALWGLLGALVVPGLAAKRPPPPPEVIVVGDVTKLGQGARVPDAANPVYYVPLTPGQSKPGDPKAGDNQPSKEEVLKSLTDALAKRHYLPAGPGRPPEIVLSFWWGTADPEHEHFGTDDAIESESFNERAMIALVGSDKKQELANWHSKDLRSAQRQERHYVIVMAFDYAAALQKQKKVLWITRMSTPSQNVDLADVIPALVTSGGPAYGRDAQPKWIDSGKPVREEKVIIAPFEVKETVPEKK